MVPHYVKPAVLSIITIAAGYTVVRHLSSAPPLFIKDQASPAQPSQATAPSSTSTVGISAAGYLEPVGNVLELAAPTQAYNMQPLVSAINVKEGDNVTKGQVLAEFDTLDRLSTQEASALELIRSLNQQLEILKRETTRYRVLAAEGAAPDSERSQRELSLLELQSKLVEANADLRRIREDKRYSVLVSPIDGTVLKIMSNPGERVMPYGVVKIGRTDHMGAIVQVYESYIGKIRIGQSVTIKSENGSFSGSINGRVSRIAPIVGQRQNLSLDPSADSDTEARTFDVDISIDKADNSKVSHLTGAKVIALF